MYLLDTNILSELVKKHVNGLQKTRIFGEKRISSPFVYVSI